MEFPDPYAGAFVYYALVPLMALVPLLDCIGKVSRWLPGVRRYPEALLLPATVLVGHIYLNWTYHHTDGIMWSWVLAKTDPATHAAAMARLAYRHRMADLYYRFDVAAVLLSSFAAPWLAMRQKRNPAVWLVLGFFGNLGAVIWLIANGRRAAPQGSDRPVFHAFKKMTWLGLAAFILSLAGGFILSSIGGRVLGLMIPWEPVTPFGWEAREILLQLLLFVPCWLAIRMPR